MNPHVHHTPWKISSRYLELYEKKLRYSGWKKETANKFVSINILFMSKLKNTAFIDIHTYTRIKSVSVVFQ